MSRIVPDFNQTGHYKSDINDPEINKWQEIKTILLMVTHMIEQ
jgi:hypothetical protein